MQNSPEIEDTEGGIGTVKKPDWCPTQGGSYTAYEPEWRPMFSDDDAWKPIPYSNGTEHGIPYPRWNCGVTMQIGLMGYSQAQALAWSFSAQAEAVGDRIEVRVQGYDVIYDIKARKFSDADTERAKA